MHWWCIVGADSAKRVEKNLDRIFGEPYILGDWGTIGGRYEHLQEQLDEMGPEMFFKKNVDMNNRAWSPLIVIYDDDSWGLRSPHDYFKHTVKEEVRKYFVVDYHH